MTSKSLVCVNISPSLDCVEIIKIQEKQAEIERAGSFPVFFDMDSRLMGNEAEMAEILKVLYEAHRIPISTPTVLVLPSFFTRECVMPTKLSDDEIYKKLLGKVREKSLFKESPIQLDWVQLGNGRVLYSAYPKEEIDKYIRIFHQNRTPLIAIDLNYFSILRGLIATGAIEPILDSEKPWLLMTISDHLFSAAKFQGTQMFRVIEVPIPQSEDAQGALQMLKEDIQDFLEGKQLRPSSLKSSSLVSGNKVIKNYPSIVCVDNTEHFSSKELLETLDLTDKVTLISQTEGSLRSRGEGDGEYPCSLEAIGGAFYTEYSGLPFIDWGLQNEEEFLALANVRRKLFKSLIMVNAFAFIVVLFLSLLVHFAVAEKETQLSQVTRQVDKIDRELSAESFQAVSHQLFISKRLKHNIAMNNIIIHAAKDFPKTMQMNRMRLRLASSTGPLSISMEGETSSKQSVTFFAKALNTALEPLNLSVTTREEQNLLHPHSTHYHHWHIVSPLSKLEKL